SCRARAGARRFTALNSAAGLFGSGEPEPRQRDAPTLRPARSGSGVIRDDLQWVKTPGIVRPRRTRVQGYFAVTALFAGASLVTSGSIAEAAPCLIVTLTGTQGGPQSFNGLGGAGTLVRYGDDANDCGSVKLQFDAGRGTTMRLSQLG